jgi:hypothetical protein
VLSLSGVLRVTLDRRGRVVAARWFSVVLDGGLPRPDPSNASAALVATVSRQDFPGAGHHWDISASGVFRLPSVRHSKR